MKTIKSRQTLCEECGQPCEEGEEYCEECEDFYKMLCVECGDVCEQGEELCERCKEEKHSNHIEGSDSDGNDEADWF